MKNKGKRHLLIGFSPTANLADSITCLLLLSAAFFSSCSTADMLPSSQVESTIRIMNLEAGQLSDIYRTRAAEGTVPERVSRAVLKDQPGIRHLDVFIFNDDENRKLDSYCSIGKPETSYFRVESGSGDKLVVVIANIEDRDFSASEIMTYDKLENMEWELRNENPSYPVMSGECHINAGESGYTAVQLTPLLSNVCLDFLKVDFSGKGYRSRTLENASVFLTNASATAELLRVDGFSANDLVNCGELDLKYLEGMKRPDMLKSRVTPGQWIPVNLYCYPNDGADGSLGKPVTRMVVQGDIDGQTYYYPIEINQEGFGYHSGPHGLSRNVKYSYSLTITRKGSLDPDTLVEPESIVTQGWIKLYPGQLLTGKTGEKLHIWVEMYPEGAELDISREDLDYDVERGIYEYEMDKDGHGVTLTLRNNGTGMFTIDAGEPINDGFLVIVVVNP